MEEFTEDQEINEQDYTEEELEEAKKKGFLKGLVKGGLHRDLGVPAGKPIPAGKLAKALHSDDPKIRRRAQFAKNAKSFSHKRK
jgi:hypothetical protein